MKKLVSLLLMLVGVVAIVGGMGYLWSHRPWRVVLEVNGHAMTAGEVAMRGRGLLEDAKQQEHLIVPKTREAEALYHFEEEAVKLWIFKVLMLDEAVARKLEVTKTEAEESLKLMEKRLATRKSTLDEYFKHGPLPEEMLRREFQEGVLVNKLLKEEVELKIELKPEEITKMQEDLQKAAMLQKKQPQRKIDRKFAVDMLRAQRYKEGVKKFYESLRAKAEVKSSEFPQLEAFKPSGSAKPPQVELAKPMAKPAVPAPAAVPATKTAVPAPAAAKSAAPVPAKPAAAPKGAGK